LTPVHPVLFHVPVLGLPVYAYGFMLGLGLVIGWNLALLECRRRGWPLAPLMRGIPVVIACALLGSRWLYLASHLDQAGTVADWFRLSAGGIVAYGGFLGGIAGAALAFGRGGLGFLNMADLMTPSVALGTVLTRIGCFLNGCDFGVPTTAPWGVAFPPGSPAWRLHGRELPVHATQLYEAGAALVLFGAVLWVARRARVPGQVFLFFFTCYGMARAAIELLRGDPSRGLLLGLPTSQALGLATALLGLLAWPLLASRGGCPRTQGEPCAG
jgi:phosphatidylglycerol:prolipoprotein diacylglycerol transferase